MKLRIVEEHPGEVRERAEDVVRVIEKLAGRSLLRKSDPAPALPTLPSGKYQFTYAALDEGIAKARTHHVESVRAHMNAKITAILSAS